MSADERNDTIAQLSLATYPYPGEKSKKHKEIWIMKRYLSLVLALVLALSVFCGVSVFAEDADVNRIPPTCVHMWSAPSQKVVTEWHDGTHCEGTTTVTETQTCPLCGEVKTTTYTHAEDNHSWVQSGPSSWIGGYEHVLYKCTKCNAIKYVPDLIG